MSTLKRIGCLFLSLALLFSAVSPGLTAQPLLALQARAAETEDDTSDPASGTAEQITVSFNGDNCTVLDANGDEINGSVNIAAGSNLVFQVQPAEGYKVVSVQAEDTDLTAAEDGCYTCQPEADMAIEVTCEEKTAPVFTASVLPEDPAREKYFQIELTSSDAEIALTAYSKQEFENLEALQNAITPTVDPEGMPIQPTAFLVDANTVVTEEGTYYLYLVDVENRMAVLSVEVSGIDTTAPAIPVVTRLENGWVKETSYDITFDDPDDIAKVEIVPPNGSAYEVVADNEGRFTFTVDANGTYTVKAYDAAGNAADYAIEEAKIDTNGPVISTPVRQDSTWTTETSYTFTATDEGCGHIQSVTVTQGGKEVDLSQKDGTYQFSVAANGTYVVTAIDALGNKETIEITENKIDLIAPVIVSATAQSDWDPNQNIITVTASDDCQLKEVSCIDPDRQECDVSHNGSGSYIITARQNGDYTVTVTDEAGNEVSKVVTVSKIDATAPDDINLSSSAGNGWTNTDVVLTVSAQDAQSGIVAYWYSTDSDTFNEGTWNKLEMDGEIGKLTITEDQESNYYVVAENAAGLISEVLSTHVAIDKTAPVFSEPVRDENSWATSAAYAFTVAETGSGLAGVYSAISGTEVKLAADSDGEYRITVTGNQQLTIRAVDNAGNEQRITITEEKIDTEDPVLALTRVQEGWTPKSDYVITADDSGSGIKSVVITTGSGEGSTLTADENGEYHFSLEENTTFTVKATDNLGHEVSMSGEETQIDTEAPEILAVQRDSTGWAYSAQYRIAASDELSGIALVTVVLNSTEEIEVTMDGGDYLFCAEQNGDYTVTVTDLAGNTATESIAEANLDHSKPQISKPVRDTDSWATTATYSFTVTDEGSGIKLVQLTIGSGEAVTLTADEQGIYSFQLTENEKFTIAAQDEVGNKAEASGEEDSIDKVAPVISDLTRLENSWAQSATYTFTVSDTGSGVADVSLSYGDTILTLDPDKDGVYSFTLDASVKFAIAATDGVGNSTRKEGKEDKVDTAAPEISKIQRLTEGWARSSEYRIAVTDADSGIASVVVVTEDGAKSQLTAAENGNYSFAPDVNGDYTVTVTDNAGNAASASFTEDRLDQSKPQISEPVRTEDSWTASAAYTFTVTDEGSGISHVLLTIGTGVSEILTPDEQGVYSFSLTENETFTITALDLVGNDTSISGTEDRVDTTAPVFSSLTRQQGDWAQSATYTFTVSDIGSGVAVVSLSYGNTALTLKPNDSGLYTFTLDAITEFTITATDGAGNSAEAEGEETQVDTVVPVILEISRITDGWSYTAEYAVSAEDVHSAIASVVVTTENGMNLAPTKAEDGTYRFIADQNGPYTITVTDLAGNATASSVTEDHLDHTEPQISKPIRDTNSWATSATYSFTVSDPASGVKQVQLCVGDGEPETLTANEQGIYSFTLSANSAFTVTALDTVGNEETASGEEAYVDTVAPVFSELTRLEGSWAQSATYTFTVSDSPSGIKGVSISYGNVVLPLTPDQNGLYTFTLDSNTKFTVAAADRAGNTAYANGEERLVDTTAPEISKILRVTDGWSYYSEYVITATDIHSGIVSVIVTSENGTKTNLAAAEDGTYHFDVKRNGKYSITVTDSAGNITEASVTEDHLDQVKPVISAVKRTESSWATSATYTFTVSDPASGVKLVQLCVGDGVPEILTADKNGIYSFTLNENAKFTVTAEDAVGNQETTSGEETYVDTDAPVMDSFTRQQKSWTQSAVYSFGASDADSGMGSVTLTYGNTVLKLEADADGRYTFALDSCTGFAITLTDNVGNTVTISGEEKMVDTTKPEVQKLERITEGWSYHSEYAVTVADAHSGIMSVTVTSEDGTKTNLAAMADGTYHFVADKNGKYTVTVTDKAGNITDVSVTEDDLDQVKPVISAIKRTESSWATSATYTFTVSDPSSGVKLVLVSVGGAKPEVLTADKNGIYSFTLTANDTFTVTAQDAVGNEEMASGKETYIDTTGPVFTALTRQENGWTHTATYTFEVFDESSGVGSVALSYGSKNLTLKPDESGIYTFTLDVNTKFSVTATDNVGNTTSTNGTENRIDRVDPEILRIERLTQSWSYSSEYAVTVADEQSGIASVVVTAGNSEQTTLVAAEDGTFRFIASQNGQYTITVTDHIGNSTSTSVTEALLDQQPPQVSNVKRSSDTWTQDAIYTFQVSDPDSGIASVIVLMGKQEIPLTVENKVYSFLAAANGEYVIVATDVVGNQKTVSLTEALIDLTAPVISNVAPQTEWDANQNTVTITASDDKELVSVAVTDAAGNVLNVTSAGKGTFRTVVTSNGDYAVTATDRAGNSVTVSFTVWHIDTTQPTTPVLTSSGNEKWVNTDVTLTASSQDTQSGVAAYWYSTSSKVFSKDTWKKMEFANGIGTLKLAEEQNLIYFVIAEDVTGRLSDPATIRVSIDKTAPETISLGYLKTSESGYLRDVAGVHIYNDKFGFHMEATDSASGVAAYEYRIVTEASASDWTKCDGDASGLDKILEMSKDTDASVYVRAYDIAGNCTDAYTNLISGKAERFIVEVTPATDAERAPAPQVDTNIASGFYTGGWTNEDVIIRVSGSQDVSGIEYYQWRMVPADPALAATQWAAVPVVDGVSQLTVSADTNATYYFRAVTYAGNHSMEASASVKVQKTLPKTAIVTPEAATGSDGWFTKLPSYAVTLPEQYAYGAPVQYIIHYTHNGESYDDLIYDGTNAPKLDKDGIWTVQFISSDGTGNTNPAETVKFRVDTKAPDALDVLLDGVSILNIADGSTQNGSVVISDKTVISDFAVFKNRTVTITAEADGGDSGLAAIYYQFIPKSENFSREENWKLLEESGAKIQPNNQEYLFFKAVDNAGNITYFTGKSVIVDSAAGSINITPTGENLSGHGFYYGNASVNITVEEPNADTVFAGLNTITYRVLNNGTVTQSGTLYAGSVEYGRINAWTGQVQINAAQNNSNNVILEVTATDYAGNSKTVSSGMMKIDVTKPDVQGRFDMGRPVAEIDGMAYFTGSRSLTVTVYERNFVAAESRIYVTDKDTGKSVAYEWESNDMTHTATLDITADGHYTVTASIVDAAGNRTEQILFSDGSVATGTFVIDNTKPTVTVHYDNNEGRDIYFNAPRTATVTVVERNFDPADFTDTIRVTDFDGVSKDLNLTGWTSDGNTHTAIIRFETDGVYHVSVTTSDIAGNQAEGTVYNGDASQEWVLDQHITAPEISGIRKNTAYGAEVLPEVTALDPNLEDIQVQLLRTTFGMVEVDVTEELISKDIKIEEVNGGKFISLDIFPVDEDMDGIYTLVATSTDKAGNSAVSSMTFSINRNGSTYVYEKNVLDVMGKTMQVLPSDLVIKEINPTRLVPGSYMIQITKDGTPIANPVFSVNPKANGMEETSNSGWYEYRYTISKENFTEDGTYTVVVSTKDAAGNLPENTEADMAIRFSIDTTAPELTSVVGLEKAIVKADSLNVAFTAIDNIGLSSIGVYVDGKLVSAWTELDGYTHEATFTISEGMNRHIRIVMEDKAGNVLDTDAEGFDPGYSWQDVTVSSNALLRFYANKPLFYSTIVCSALLIAGIMWFLIWKRRRDNEEYED